MGQKWIVCKEKMCRFRSVRTTPNERGVAFSHRSAIIFEELFNAPEHLSMFYINKTFPAAINSARTIGCPHFAKPHYIECLNFSRNYSVGVPRSQQMFLKVTFMDYKHLQDINGRMAPLQLQSFYKNR